MPVSPVRDLASIVAGLVLVLLIPLVLSGFVFRVTSVPLTQDYQLQITSGDASHMYFVSILGMSQLWFNMLSTQLGVANLLSRAFAVITTDWIALSVALFLLTGAIAAFVLKGDLERIVVPVAIGLATLLLGVLFVEGFIRGLTGLEEFTRIGISNALNVLVVVSYGVGTLLSSIVSFGLGKLVFRGAPKSGVAPTTAGTAAAKPAEAEVAKPTQAGEEPPRAVEHATSPVKEVQRQEVAPVKPKEPPATAPAVVPAATTPVETPKAISASERVETTGIEEVIRQTRGPAVEAPEAKPSPEPTAKEELPRRVERERLSRELFTALEEPMQRMSSKVEKEPGAVWRPIPCPVCGSELTWSSEKQAYYCPFCGTVP